jgi:hypothetical protein
MQLVLRNDNGKEYAVPIRGEGLAICRAGGNALGVEPAGAARPFALVVPVEEHGAPRAALICSPLGTDLLVSGYRPLGGLCLLEDRAEISVRGARLFFVGADPQPVMRFPAKASAVNCARCHGRLAVGDDVQRCPFCRRWMHEGQPVGRDVKLDCASYDERCPSCGRERGVEGETGLFFEEHAGA